MSVGGEEGLGRITVPFKKRFEKELDSLRGFRDALRSLEMQAAYDEIIKRRLEQGPQRAYETATRSVRKSLN